MRLKQVGDYVSSRTRPLVECKRFRVYVERLRLAGPVLHTVAIDSRLGRPVHETIASTCA
jgi:hypothetical protein